MNGLEYYNKREYLSISSLCAFARCPRRYFYSSGCRLKDGPPHSALLFGEAIHKAFPLAVLSGVQEAMRAFDTVWDDANADDKRNRDKATLMLADVHHSHKGARSLYELLEPPGGALEIEDRVSDYEVPFAIDIGLDVPLVGRIDGLVRHRDTKELFGLEIKTSQEVSGRYFDQYQIHPQPQGYTLALRQLVEEPVAGVIVEALRVSKTPRVETLPHPIRVSDFELKDFVTWAHFIGSQLLECERLGEFPKAPSGCATYAMFGQSGFVCDFQRLCKVEDWTTMADTFEVGNDRPFVMPTIKKTEQ